MNEPESDLARRYDAWFDRHVNAYHSEIAAIRRYLPAEGLGIEVGVGTGRFAAPLGIRVGVDPSETRATIARGRGVKVFVATGECLPFPAHHFDYALMVTVICFVRDPSAVLREVRRVLVPDGTLVLAIIDKETSLGREYDRSKATNPLFLGAQFHSTAEVLATLAKAGFTGMKTCQTIFSSPDSMRAPDAVLEGHGTGAFVVIRRSSL